MNFNLMILCCAVILINLNNAYSIANPEGGGNVKIPVRVQLNRNFHIDERHQRTNLNQEPIMHHQYSRIRTYSPTQQTSDQHFTRSDYKGVSSSPSLNLVLTPPDKPLTNDREDRQFSASNVDNEIYNYGTECPPDGTGQFPYLMDCRQFLNCFKGRGYIQSCAPGTLFNPETRECDYPSKVICGSLNNPNSKLRTAPSSRVIVNTLPSNYNQNKNKIECEEGVSGLFEHPFDCTKFLNCGSGRTYIQDCGPGTVFNKHFQICDWPHNVDCTGKIIRHANDDEGEESKQNLQVYSTTLKIPVNPWYTQQGSVTTTQRTINQPPSNPWNTQHGSFHHNHHNHHSHHNLHHHNQFNTQQRTTTPNYPVGEEFIHNTQQAQWTQSNPPWVRNNQFDQKNYREDNDLDVGYKFNQQPDMTINREVTVENPLILGYPSQNPIRPPSQTTNTNVQRQPVWYQTTSTTTPSSNVQPIYIRSRQNNTNQEYYLSKKPSDQHQLANLGMNDSIPLSEALKVLLKPYMARTNNISEHDMANFTKTLDSKTKLTGEQSSLIGGEITVDDDSNEEESVEMTTQWKNPQELPNNTNPNPQYPNIPRFNPDESTEERHDNHDYNNCPNKRKHYHHHHNHNHGHYPHHNHFHFHRPNDGDLGKDSHNIKNSTSTYNPNSLSGNYPYHNPNIYHHSSPDYNHHSHHHHHNHHHNFPSTNSTNPTVYHNPNFTYHYPHHHHHSHPGFQHPFARNYPTTTVKPVLTTSQTPQKLYPVFTHPVAKPDTKNSNPNQSGFTPPILRPSTRLEPPTTTPLSEIPPITTTTESSLPPYIYDPSTNTYIPAPSLKGHYPSTSTQFPPAYPVYKPISTTPKSNEGWNINDDDTNKNVDINNKNDFPSTGVLPIYPTTTQSIKNVCDSTNTFQCGNGQCVSRDKVCDGKNDCGNRADENNCDSIIGYQVRLSSDSDNKHEGRVEVKVFGVWGYICDDKFGMRDADVLCRELGFPLGASEVRGNSYYSPNINVTHNGTPIFLMDELDCQGNETSIKDCNFDGWGVHDCNTEEVVGVVCKIPVMTCPLNYWLCDTSQECIPIGFICDGVSDCSDGTDENQSRCKLPFEIRLVGGIPNLEGRLEVRHNGIWGTVCDDDFGNVEATVVCRMLGHGGPASFVKSAFGPGVGQIWLDQVACIGNETSIADCSHWHWGEHNCAHAEDVGIKCTAGPVRPYTPVRNSNKTARSYQEVPDIVYNMQRSSKILPDQCGEIKVPDVTMRDQTYHFRVIKGIEAKKGFHPWQSTIRVKGHGKSSHWCGAVLISRYHLLTAAHCLIGFPKGAYIIRMGDHNSEEFEPSEVEIFIENTYIHEDFRKGHHMNNDIAVIVLKSPVRFTNYIQPICLPSKNIIYEPGMNCTISGWGSIQSGKSSVVPILSNELCKQPQVYGDAITDGMFCAGSLDEGIDACDGDSGGPLVCLNNGVHTLYGIISWGQHCGYANRPGVYTKVSYYTDWIQQKLNQSMISYGV